MFSLRAAMVSVAAFYSFSGASQLRAESEPPSAGGNRKIVSKSELQKSGLIIVEEAVDQAIPLKRTITLKSIPQLSRAQKGALAPSPSAASAGFMPVAFRELRAEAGDFVSDRSSVIYAAMSGQDTSELSRRIDDLVRDGMLPNELATDLQGKLGRQLNGSPLTTNKSEPAVTRAVTERGGPETLEGPSSRSSPSSPSLTFSESPKPANATIVASSGAVPVGVSAAPVAAETWALNLDDRTVRQAFERWAREANWLLSWEYPHDFQIQFAAQFEGDLIDAVGKVVEGLSAVDRPIRAEFYGGNRVLRVLSGRE